MRQDALNKLEFDDFKVYGALKTELISEEQPVHTLRVTMNLAKIEAANKVYAEWVKAGKLYPPPEVMSVYDVLGELPNYDAVAGSEAALDRAVTFKMSIHPKCVVLSKDVKNNVKCNPYVAKTKRKAEDEAGPSPKKVPPFVKKAKIAAHAEPEVEESTDTPVPPERPTTPAPPAPVESELTQLLDVLKSLSPTALAAVRAAVAPELPTAASTAPVAGGTSIGEPTLAPQQISPPAAQPSDPDLRPDPNLSGRYRLGKDSTVLPEGVTTLHEIIASTSTKQTNDALELAFTMLNDARVLSVAPDYHAVGPPNPLMPDTIVFRQTEHFTQYQDDNIVMGVEERDYDTVVACTAHNQHVTINVVQPAEMIGEGITVPTDCYFMMQPDDR
ncbi:uncharacterized protein LOC108673408 [Hyalella azteca]|uniref:Uncharacterized protein LOC108673408 n=1 Tax=Hyalella azteca TaxID=294128 RepID=A0A8B7NSN4_HYAAZ|nr:uncharacterized protein LOC108673408 [Hyalella azteca]